MRRSILALALALLPGAGVLVQLRASAAAALDGTHGPFIACFAPAPVAAPDAEVRRRVEAFDAALDEHLHAGDPPLFRAYARAIVTHESGGNPRAISPTGCAGAVAISAPPPGFSRCCEIDEEDGYRHGYDRCNSESRLGYRCGADDPRFTPAYAMAFAVDRFRRIHALVAAGGADAPDVRIVLPLAWNAGLGVFRSYPAGMGSPGAALAQLDFTGKAPYTEFGVRGHVNKVVEIHDYLAWFGFLTAYWAGETPAPADPPALVCVSYDAGRNRVAGVRDPVRAAIVRALTAPAGVRRLAFGAYEPDTAHVAAGPLRSLVWWLASAFA